VLFAAEVEGSMEVGGRFPQEMVEVPQLRLQEEEEGGEDCPQLEAEVVVPCPRQQEGALYRYRYGWRRSGGRYMRGSSRPGRRKRRRSSILHVVQDHVC